MSLTKVVIVGSLGATYTKPGQNLVHIENKAFAWKKIQKDVFDMKPIVKPSDVTPESWKDLQDNLILNSDRLSALKKLYDQEIDLLTCDEQQIRQSLSDIMKQKNIYKKSTLMKWMSILRQAFRAIGREHEYGQGSIQMNLGNILVNTNNPISKSNQDFLINYIKQDDLPEKRSRQGYPVSMPLVYNVIWHLINQCIINSAKINDIRRLNNMMDLALLLSFGMYEPSRPNEIFDHLNQNQLYTCLHDKVYLLTFAFLKSNTLEYILENNLVQSFVHIIWKGKCKKDHISRIRNTVPVEQNSLCLFVIYIIVMRLRVFINMKDVDESFDHDRVFKKKNDWIKQLNNVCKSLDIKDFTFYSLRYSHSEEMNKINIPESIRRHIMGHSKNSDMNIQYSKNKGMRVSCDNKQISMSCDIENTSLNMTNQNMEYRLATEEPIKYNTSFLNSLENDDMRSEFQEITLLTTKFIEENDTVSLRTLFDNITDLDISVNKKDRKNNIIKDFRQLPIGFQIKFPKECLSESIQSNQHSMFESLQDIFKKQSDKTNLIEISSFIQLAFWNWRNTGKGIQEPLSWKKDRHVEKRKLAHVDNIIPKKKTKYDTTENSPKWDFILENIEKDDIVVIICNAIDKCSFKIESINAHVWIAKAHSYKNGIFKGYFMKATQNDMTLHIQDHLRNKIESVVIEDTDCVGIYENNTISFDKDDIDDITQLVKLSLQNKKKDI